MQHRSKNTGWRLLNVVFDHNSSSAIGLVNQDVVSIDDEAISVQSDSSSTVSISEDPSWDEMEDKLCNSDLPKQKSQQFHKLRKRFHEAKYLASKRKKGNQCVEKIQKSEFAPVTF